MEHEPSLDEITADIRDVDLILVEGYKHAGKPCIEIRRGDLGLHPLLEDGELLAIASNVPLTAPVPVFDLNDAAGMADFIEKKFLRG